MGESFTSLALAPSSVDRGGAGASYDCQEDYVCARRLHSCLHGNPGSHFIFLPELLCDLGRFTSLSGPYFVSRLRHQGGLLMNLGAHICPTGTLSCLFLGGRALDGRCPKRTKEGCHTGIAYSMDGYGC